MKIVPATTPEQLAAVHQMFEEYQRTLRVPEAVQSVAGDLANFPGPYVPPRGALLVVCDGARAVGCVALRRWRGDICEMKRLYVRPESRGLGFGRALAVRVIEAARSAGYRVMRLDTLGSMDAAAKLYLSLGFREIPSYTEKPLPTAKHMELVL